MRVYFIIFYECCTAFRYISYTYAEIVKYLTWLAGPYPVRRYHTAAVQTYLIQSNRALI